MDDSPPSSRPALPTPGGSAAEPADDEVEVAVAAARRDIADVPAIEVITTAAVHLMSAAAVKCGLAEDAASGKHLDLDEARKLITALAGLVTAAAPEVGRYHAASLRDGLTALQWAFREASVVPDPPGQGPGERWTGPIEGQRRKSPESSTLS
jgi:Domain of unknown function (DUF1844)